MASEFGATYLPGGLPVGETLVGVGPVADRPDANSDLTPRFWFDSSTGLLYVDDSGTWYTLIPGTLSANTYTGNVVQRITSTAQGTSGGYWAIKISGETLDRAFLYSFGVGLGGGSSSVDAVMRRTQAKEIGFYNASVLGDLIPVLAGEPTSSTHVATKNYVDTENRYAVTTETTSRDLAIGDVGGYLRCTAAITLDVPTMAATVGDTITIRGAGYAVTLVADGTTINQSAGASLVIASGVTASLVYVASNTWDLVAP